ncbi:hypothetical protein BH23CHL7_BH23CHL7_12580 [soil metagenome]
MQIYEGSPRQDYEEVFRSIGAFLDQCAMREIAIVETVDGFIVQGLAPQAEEGRPWNDPAVQVFKRSFQILEDDVNRFIDEVVARRNAKRPPGSAIADPFYEHALRVLGRYIDEQKPRDVLLFEQDRSFVLRLQMATRTGPRHVLAEFTQTEIEGLIERSSGLRGRPGESILSART